MLSFLAVIFGIIFHVNVAKRVNIEVTLNKKDLFSIFTHDEIWGFDYVNKTSLDIIKVNVVIDETKHYKISKLANIFSIDMIYDNVEEILKQRYLELDNRTRFKSGDSPNIFFQNYRNWVEYDAFIAQFLITHSNIASISTIGQTIEGRNIPLITLSTGGSSNKPGFYIQAEVHAREWLANAATMFILNELAEGYSNGDQVIVDILDNINIYIAYTVNVDGYIYSWQNSNNRFWRKNRRNNGGGSYGVDLNRNYPAPQWCAVGASTNPNSNTYCGVSPNSEPETQATTGFLNSTANIQAVFDMHTYGPLILWPYAYTYSVAPDYTELRDLGDNLADAVEGVNGHFYVSQQASDLYPCAGTMSDHSYVEMGVKWSFTFEGRGPGFDAAPSNIIPGGQEQLAAVLEVAQMLY